MGLGGIGGFCCGWGRVFLRVLGGFRCCVESLCTLTTGLYRSLCFDINRVLGGVTDSHK